MFLHRWALRLGRTVKELLASVDSEEISEAIAFYYLEPWGEPVEDLRCGIITAAISNGLTPKSNGDWQTADDFIPKYGERLREDINAQQRIDDKRNAVAEKLTSWAKGIH